MTIAVPASRTTPVASTEVCRLTIAGPAGRADLAVPVATAVSALLPVLLRHLPADPGRPTGAWTLQRLGEDPLPLDATPQSAGLRHGDVLYLRPADDALPGLQFDDVAEGVAHAVSARGDRWRPESTRRLFHALACFVLAVLAAAAGGLGSGPAAAICCGVTAVVLGAGCAADRRKPADRVTLLITGIGACVFAALAGLTAVHGTQGLHAPARGDVLLGAIAAGLMAVAMLVTKRLPSAVPGTVLVTALCAIIAVATGWDAVGATCVLACAFFVLGHLAPRIALRLARIRVPQLPHNAGELQEDIDPEPEERITRRVATADAVLTAISISAALLSSTAFVLLARRPGWISPVFVLVLATAVLLRSKSLQGNWQRVPAVFCGTLGYVVVLLAWAHSSQTGGKVALLLGLLAGAVLLLLGAWRLPTARLLPIWGHIADILEMLTALALLPLLLQVLHAYAYFRSTAG